MLPARLPAHPDILIPHMYLFMYWSPPEGHKQTIILIFSTLLRTSFQPLGSDASHIENVWCVCVCVCVWIFERGGEKALLCMNDYFSFMALREGASVFITLSVCPEGNIRFNYCHHYFTGLWSNYKRRALGCLSCWEYSGYSNSILENVDKYGKDTMTSF